MQDKIAPENRAFGSCDMEFILYRPGCKALACALAYVNQDRSGVGMRKVVVLAQFMESLLCFLAQAILTASRWPAVAQRPGSPLRHDRHSREPDHRAPAVRCCTWKPARG